MKTTSPHPIDSRRAFTLVEMLVVIAIIGILAGILLPVIAKMPEKAKARVARIQIANIVQAITQYESTYSRLPASVNAAQSVSASGNDFTYGGTFNTPNGTFDVGSGNPPPNNSEVIAILMDLTNYPSSGLPTINGNHVKNPQQHKFLNADTTDDATHGGVGPDLVYRDPWGNPYIITLDLNNDNKARDEFYKFPAVSTDPHNSTSSMGLNGLIKNIAYTPPVFELNGSVMVWSAGPDKMIDPGQPANQSANKDNILSWKQ